MHIRKIMVVLSFVGLKLSAVEGELHIIREDSEYNLFQVESLNQLDAEQGALAKTACGYYALNNCIEIMKACMQPFQEGINVSTGLKTVSKEFETVDSSQRRAIFVKRLTAQVLELVKSTIKRTDVFKDSNKKDKENLIQLVRLSLQHVASTSVPVVDERGIRWFFTENDLSMSCKKVCNDRSDYADSFKRVIQSTNKTTKNNDFSDEDMSATLWKYIAEKAGDFLSFNKGLLTFSFSSTSDVCKEIDYGNWLDGEDITNLVSFINEGSKEEFIVEVLHMTGSFSSYFKDCKQQAKNENKELTKETAISNYEYVNYNRLKEIRDMLNDSEKEVVAGFVIHMTSNDLPFLAGLSKVFSFFLPGEVSLISNKDSSAHWISLVIARPKGGPLRYYIADSLNNKDRLKSSVVHDIIAYVEGREARNESHFNVPEVTSISSAKLAENGSLRKPSSAVARKGGGTKSQEGQGQTWSSSEKALAGALGFLGSGVVYLSLKRKKTQNKSVATETEKTSDEETHQEENLLDEREPLSVV